MDFGVVIVVIGTLGGVIISAIATYMVQQRVAQRQRKWALEDEERHRKQLLEDEQRKLKREVTATRLDIIEEAARLMANEISAKVAIELDIPISRGTTMARQRAQRFDDIHSDAWSALLITGSKELKEEWSKLSNVFWDLREFGEVQANGYDKANEALIAIIKLLDDMRIKA